MDALDPKDLHPRTMLGMKLIQQPFSKLPDAENLFDFDALKQTRDTVSHHLQFSQLLMVIQGRRGSGKNSFANSLIVSDHPALYFFNATAEASDSLQSILGKAAENNHADSIQVLEKRIHDIMYRGQQPVLIINDADQLNEGELLQLIQFCQERKDENQQTQLKLLLLGDHSLEKRIEQNGVINHNQFYIIDLPQLNVSNTEAFLMHRLTTAGFRDAPPFTKADITNIYNMANGNPVSTLEYAAESLNNNKSLYEEDFSVSRKPKKILIAFGAAIFIGAFIYNSLLTPEKESSKQIELPTPEIAENKAIDHLFSPSTNTMDIKQNNNAELLPGEAPNSLAPEIVLPPRDKMVQIPDPESLNNLAAETSAEEKTVPPTITQNSKPVSVTERADSSGIKPPETIKEKPAIKDPVADKAATTPVKNVAIKKTITEKKPTVAKADKTTRSFTNAGVRSPDWLLKQPSKNWSLQILGAYKPETLLSYIHQHQLGNKVAYFRTRLGQQDWHVILYGQYPSKDKAKAVIPYLPKYIQSNNPWPKDLKSVQKAIIQHKKLQK